MNRNEFQWILSWSILCAIFIDSWKLSLPNLRGKNKIVRLAIMVAWLITRKLMLPRGFPYHSSPSRNKSDGMSSITSWGRSNFFPVRENMAFFKGFQNPRIPSYFSNTHLPRVHVSLHMWIDIEEFDYQLVGSVCEFTKKLGFTGGPISSISLLVCNTSSSGGL